MLPLVPVVPTVIVSPIRHVLVSCTNQVPVVPVPEVVPTELVPLVAPEPDVAAVADSEPLPAEKAGALLLVEALGVPSELSRAAGACQQPAKLQTVRAMRSDRPSAGPSSLGLT